MTKSSRVALVGTLFVVTGCASVPLMPQADDLAAKAFAVPPPDRAHVYVYRNENFGGGVKLGILVDGYMAAESAAMTYVLLPVAPGRHVVTSVAENREELPIDAVAGQNYFVWQEVKMGLLSARSRLSLVDEATGKAAVSECKRAVVAPPPAAPAARPAVAPGS